jgi:hypothetical protein
VYILLNDNHNDVVPPFPMKLEVHTIILNKILINLPCYVLNVWNIDDGALLGRKQYFVLMFKVNFLGLGLFYFIIFFFSSFFFSLYIYIYIYIYIYRHTHTYNLKHNASLTHVTSFGLMTPKSVDFRVLGVETPLRA